MDAVLLAQPLERMGVPFVCEINTAMGPEYAAKGRPLRGRLYDSFQGRTLSKSAGWLVMTPELTTYAERLSGVRRPTLLAKNGFNPSRTAPRTTREEARQRLEVDPAVPVLVMAGFSRPWHGADRAIEMLTELPQGTVLWLIGSRGPEDEATTKRYAQDRGVTESVRVFPWLSEEALSDLIVAADVGLGALALDRKQFFGQALKIPLYLALGVPVLINSADFRLDSAGPFVKCVLSQDPKALAAGVRALLDISEACREEAKEFAHRYLTWQVAARETSEFLAAVLGGLGR